MAVEAQAKGPDAQNVAVRPRAQVVLAAPAVPGVQTGGPQVEIAPGANRLHGDSVATTSRDGTRSEKSCWLVGDGFARSP